MSVCHIVLARFFLTSGLHLLSISVIHDASVVYKDALPHQPLHARTVILEREDGCAEISKLVHLKKRVKVVERWR